MEKINKTKQKLNKKIGIKLSLVILILISINFVFAATDEYKPYLHKPSIGEYPKLEISGEYKTELYPGSATYNYNLITPKGINGLSPEISIIYNNQNAFSDSSILGAGWTITSNYIMRNINYTLNQTSDDYFILNINGNSYKFFKNNNSYKTEIEIYLKIENFSDSGNDYWIITTKDGTKFRFGYTNDSLLKPANSMNYTLKWFLDSVEEIHGNHVYYSYLNNPFIDDYGAVYISNITYNNDQLRKIFFYYENLTRPDRKIVYEQGNKFFESRRLNSIGIFFNSSLVRKYTFEYVDLNTEKTISGLSKINYIGSDNTSVLNSVSFEYYDSQPGFEDSDKWLVPEEFSTQDINSKDLGIRLVDVDNDGFEDLVKSYGSTNYTKLNDKNNSWISASTFSVPEQIVDSSNNFQGVFFVDVNKDGLVDLIKSRSNDRKVYLNNGSQWILSNWSIPVDFIDSSYNDEGVRLLDLNGDGRIDIIKAKEGSTKQTWINNGSGWVNDSLWICPDNFAKSDGKDNGIRELDLNGDGLTDLLKEGQLGNAWINNGSGWVNDLSFAPNLSFTDPDKPDLGVRFMDINGDHLIDILQNYYINASILNQTCFNQTGNATNCTYHTYSNLTNVKINNGSGWIYSPSWQSPEQFTYNGYNNGRRIADVNGDGYPDIVVGYNNGSFIRKTHLRNASNAYILKKIINEYGGTSTINYGKSTLFDNGQNIGFNIWVVSNVTINNSLTGNFSLVSANNYNYSGGKFDYTNSEFLGFNVVNENLFDGTVITHFFNQDRLLKGTEYMTRIYDSIKHYKDEINSYTISPNNEIILNETSELFYEGNIQPLVINTSYKYDQYGNVLLVNYSGNVNINGDEKFEEYSYIYNTSIYIVDKISNYSLYNSSSNLVKRSWYSYDNLTGQITKGDISKVENYNNNGANPQTKYEYDNYGNVITEIDPKGNKTYYQYDNETNTFLIKSTNALGHITYFSYDKGTSNLISQTKDGITKNYTFDIFGRPANETIPPDTENYPTKITTYYLDGTSPEIIKIQTKNNNTDYSGQMFFYDGFSNLIQIKTKYNNNTQIVKNFKYDGKSRIINEEHPYFSQYSNNIDPGTNNLSSSYTYDSLDRVINLTKPDNNSIKIIFNNSMVTSVNENNIPKDYILNAYGRIINVYEHNRNESGVDEIYNTSYFYDTSGNLVKIIDSQNNSFLFGFDSLGKKIFIDDPNTNPRTYSYDLNGNLINQTDGRNITNYFYYDSLNRLILKKAGKSNVSFVYDGQYNGTLTNITTDSDYFNIVYNRYTYDNRLRIIKEELFYCYREIDPGADECEWINVSKDYDSQDKILNLYIPNTNLSYEYNNIGKLEEIKDFLNSINYNAFGKISNKTYSNGLITYFEYDSLSRINRIGTGNIQNLSYSYDPAGNVKQINDSKNSMQYSMNYDDLDRLTQTIIKNFITYEHERYKLWYDKIGNKLFYTNDMTEMNYSYNSSRAHAPAIINESNRPLAKINLDILNPINKTFVNWSSLFNFTVQVCCKNNDCWGINVSLDPEEHSYTPTSETVCNHGICTTTIYSETKFAYEDEEWKKVENARSLKGIYQLNIKEDPNFPVEVVDFNYTSIILNLSVSKNKISQVIPLKIYNRLNNSEKPRDSGGNIRDKDQNIKLISSEEKQKVIIDLSDTSENVLNQEIKWGDYSTIITIYDNNSMDTDDAYIRDGASYAGTNYGSDIYLYVQNSSSSNKNSLIRFDISQIPSQALIDNAYLYLYLSNNNLNAGVSYNVSVHRINNSYQWTEESVTWDSGPQSGTDYDLLYLDKVYINNSMSNSYLSWNVTSAIKLKNKNQSFYIKAIENNGGSSTSDVGFSSKEHPGQQKPYLNVTYRLKGLVSNIVGETPFYTNVTNPHLVDLEQDQCQNITWVVNATGNYGNYIFFAYANKTSNTSISNRTFDVDVEIPKSSLNASLIFPVNNLITPNQTQNFTVNITDDYGIKNATIYIFNSSQDLVNQTTINFASNPLTYVLGIVVNLLDGVYKWFYNIVDVVGNSFSTENNTLIIDSKNPRINIIYPQNTTYTINVSKLNYSYSDENSGYCWYSKDNGTTNSSAVSAGQNFTNVISIEGSNTWIVYCNDSSGNFNSSSVTFIKDTIYPQFLNFGDNNGTLLGSGLAIFNVTIANTNGTVLFEINGTNYTANNISAIVYNYSLILSNGTYSYKWHAYGNGAINNYNVSQTQSYTVLNLGASQINISFIYPTPSNATSTTNTSIQVNISIDSENLNELKFNWNGTNYTVYDDSLVLMYNFDNVSALGENSTYAVDVSKYGNNGTINGAIINSSSGKYRMGISFNGSSSVSTFTASFNNFSVCAWAKPSSIPNAIKHIVATDAWTGFYLYISSGNGSRFGVNNGQETEIYTIPDITNWHYYCGVYNSTNVSLFVDGILRKTSPASGPTTPRLIKIGAGVSYYFNGSIDEVRIWNKSLSSLEIQELYFINLNKYNSSQWYLYVNQSKNATTGLDIGNYSYFASAKNNNGNENITEIRFLSITNPLSYPSIGFIYPTPMNGTTTSNTSVIVNVSINEANLNEVKWNWNGTNYAIYSDSLILMINFDNISSFGEGANNFTADVSKYNNSGNCTGMSAGCNWIAGKYGKGISFDGVNDKITTFSASFLNFTVCAWAKPSVAPNAIKHIIATNVWTGFYLYVTSSNGSVFGVNNGQETGIYTVSGITDWHYYCGVYNSTNVSLFVDGILRKTSPASGATTSAPIWIGAGVSYFFNGSIDEARIWNSSLSSNEINEMYMANLQKFNSTQWYLYINQSKNSTSGLDIGSYTYSASAKNSNGNENTTETRWITIESEGEFVTNCRNLNSPGATYILNSDIINDTITSDCIVISAQNITLNCKGHSIHSTQNYSGIYSNQYNTAIKNCNITMGGASGSNLNAIGIEFASVNNGAIYNNTCNASVGYGIYLNNSLNNNLTSNTGISNSNTGIYIYSGSNNSLINNTGTSKSSRGIFINGGSNNNLINNLGTSDLISGIYFYSSNNNILSDNTGICSSGYGIYLNNGSNNNLTGNIGASNISYGFYLYSGSNNNIFNSNTGTSNTSYAVYLFNSNNNTLMNQNATGYLTGSYGFFLLNSNNNTIKDCVYVSGLVNDVYLTSNSINNTFINCSYTISKESIQPGSQLFRKWWYRAYVNDSLGNSINNANVNAYNVTGSLEFSKLTSGDGYTSITQITDYVNYGGTRSYYSNYTINATNGTSTASHSYNVTLNLNNLNDVFTL